MKSVYVRGSWKWSNLGTSVQDFCWALTLIWQEIHTWAVNGAADLKPSWERQQQGEEMVWGKMPDTQASLIKTCGGHLTFLFVPLPPFGLHTCADVCVCLPGEVPAGVKECVWALGGLQTGGSLPWQQAPCTLHTHHISAATSISVSEKKKSRLLKTCLRAHFCRLVPFELQLQTWSQVRHKRQVKKLCLTADHELGVRRDGGAGRGIKEVGELAQRATKAMGVLISRIYVFTHSLGPTCYRLQTVIHSLQ